MRRSRELTRDPVLTRLLVRNRRRLHFGRIALRLGQQCGAIGQADQLQRVLGLVTDQH